MREVELKVRVPEDLAEDLERMEPKELSLLVNSLLMEKFSRLVELAKIFEKSKLSQEEADEFAERFNERLYRRYKKLQEE